MKKALILHSWFGSPEKNWYPWLRQELKEKGYFVEVPALPTMSTDSPDMEIMLKFIDDMKLIDNDTLVIGHSLGSVLALRLAEQISFKQGILFAAWDYNDLTPEHQSFWKTMMDHERIKQNVKEWILPLSENDPYVTLAIAKEIAARVNGKVIEMGKKGHFGEDDGVTEIPEILELV